MPNLAALLTKGKWTDVVATNIGSAAVWPSFLLGEPAPEHGVYAEWLWDPSTMGLARYVRGRRTAFYERLHDKGVGVGTLDVPFDSIEGSSFAIREWGAHYVVDGSLSVSPSSIRATVDSFGRHPYSMGLLAHDSAADVEGMRANAEGSVRGTHQRGGLALELIREGRPELAIIGFSELHHAGHFLWHTTDPDNPLYEGMPSRSRYLQEGVSQVYSAADEQLGRLVSTLEPASVMVFALNGMEPYRGTPDLLSRLLQRDGYAVRAASGLSVRARTRALLSYAKRKSPLWARKMYHRTTSRELQRALARTTLLEPLDWALTRAFEPPPEEYSNVRLNLRGREALGIVDKSDYHRLVQEIAEKIEALRTLDGRPAARSIIRPNDGRAEDLLPDLVVQWDPQAIAPGTVAGFPHHVMHSANHSGHHRPRGFCITTGPISDLLPDTVLCEDLHQPILETF